MQGVCFVSHKGTIKNEGTKEDQILLSFFVPLWICFVPLCELFIHFPGVRGLALSPAAAFGSGGKVSRSFNGTPIGVASCRFPSSNRLNSASSRSASSFFFNREYARKS